MDITKILLQTLGNGGLEQLSNQAGMKPQQTSSAMSAMIPTLLSAMARNTSSQSGAEGLLGALTRDHDGGGLLDNIGSFLGNTEGANGNGILKHVLGNDRNQVEQGLASKLGVNASSIGKLLPIVAPMVMAYLGREKNQSTTPQFEASNISSILGGLAGGSRQDDGIDIGDILNMVGGLSGGNSTSGGGLIGGLLKNVLKG